MHFLFSGKETNFMAVRKEENGKWTVDIYIENYDGTRKRYKKRGFSSKREAQEWVAINKNGNEGNPSNNILNYYFEEYLKTLECNIESKKGYRNALNKYAPFLLKTKYSKITKIKLLEWRNGLSTYNLSSKTKNKLVGLLKSTCNFAYKIYGLKDPSVILERFKTPLSEYKELNIWTPTHFKEFIQNIEKPIEKAYFTLLFNTGMRRSEAKALLKSDVSLNSVKVNKSMRHGKYSVKLPKTKGSIRTVLIDTHTYNFLKPLLDRPGKWLFGDFSPIGASTIQRAFNIAIKKSNVPAIRIHDLRHSHASLLIANGADIVAVSKRLGHSDINMTLKIYTHLIERKNIELVHIIEKINN